MTNLMAISQAVIKINPHKEGNWHVVRQCKNSSIPNGAGCSFQPKQCSQTTDWCDRSSPSIASVSVQLTCSCGQHSLSWPCCHGAVNFRSLLTGHDPSGQVWRVLPRSCPLSLLYTKLSTVKGLSILQASWSTMCCHMQCTAARHETLSLLTVFQKFDFLRIAGGTETSWWHGRC